MTEVLLGAEIFGGGLFPYLYEEAGGWFLTPKQLPEERRSWKNDLFAYCKETIELLFQRIIQSAELKECKVKGEGLNGALAKVSMVLLFWPMFGSIRFASSLIIEKANQSHISKINLTTPAGASQLVDCNQL